MAEYREINMEKIILIFLLILLLTGCQQAEILLSGNLQNKQMISQTGNFVEIFDHLQIPAEYALVIAHDGTAYFISESSFSKIELVKKNDSFNTVSDQLPPVCNLNHIKEICIYNSNFPQQDHLTPFASRIAEFDYLGQISRNNHFVRKYKLKKEK